MNIILLNIQPKVSEHSNAHYGDMHAALPARTHMHTLRATRTIRSNIASLMDRSSDEISSAYHYHDITVLFQSVTELAFGLEACNHSATFPKTTL